MTKLRICRYDRIRQFHSEAENDLKEYLDNVFDEKVQKNIGDYVERLRTRKMKKSKPFTNENLV